MATPHLKLHLKCILLSFLSCCKSHAGCYWQQLAGFRHKSAKNLLQREEMILAVNRCKKGIKRPGVTGAKRLRKKREFTLPYPDKTVYTVCLRLQGR
ncbi:hypothetical protein [Pantoea ananatis]|uniref:hypothetical protein n=1 Tax=Pantoea ananas TaxID=553 RepID=UPI0021F77AC0|nr:hypothetical protein [Pantoea ananatis]